MKFELQGIYTLSGTLHAKEVLYRGVAKPQWLEVDAALMQTLSDPIPEMGRVFVNVCNHSLLNLPIQSFLAAHRANDVVLELSEALTDSGTFEQVSKRINLLGDMGIRFALDDFGSGRDGLNRLYALKQVAYIKVDGKFLHVCMRRSDAAAALKTLIGNWNACGIKVIAEWVETNEVMNFCQSIGFHLVQGWFADGLYGKTVLTGEEEHEVAEGLKMLAQVQLAA